MSERYLSRDSKKSVYENTNGFPMSNGKNLHMEVGPGELANRIITVGSVQRAELVASFLQVTTKVTSSRGFTTITGYFNDILVSVVSIGMGTSMMDFFVRESRAVVDGPMAIVRFGTCGGLSLEAPEGSIVVSSKGSGYITRNPDYFVDGSTNSPYNIHKVATSDISLSALVKNRLSDKLADTTVVEGLNVTADSFYSSQGRIDTNFNDNNEDIISDVIKTYEDVKTMEMESFILLHLANCSITPIYATAAVIVVANRISSKVIDGDSLNNLELQGGLAILEAIISFNL